MTTKGQVTVPKEVRHALHLEAGDLLLFRVEGEQATVRKVPNFLDLAGSISVPEDKRDASWDEIRRATWEARAIDRR